MKFKIEYSGDVYEDREFIDIQMRAHDLASAVEDARNTIRNRLKHCEGVTEQEATFLEEIRDILYIEGLSW